MKIKGVSGQLLTALLTVSILLLNWNVAFAKEDGASASSHHRRPDLSRLVVVGDSLSAGFQSGSLIETAQVNGYASLIAEQAGVQLPLPLIASPGIPNVLTLIAPGPPPIIVRAPGVSPGRVDPFLQPFNLAVPGHNVEDALSTRPDIPVDSLTDLILGLPGTFIFGQPPRSQVELAQRLNPTTVIVWLGSNDALGAALSGDPAFLTPTASFKASYRKVMNRLSAEGVTVVVANVPDVTVVPALTPAKTVAEEVGLPLSTIGPILGIGPKDFVTTAAFSLIPSILANPSSGPLPGNVVLTGKEANKIRARVDSFNEIIADEAKDHRAVLVDIHSLLETLSEEGYVVDGQRLTTDFLGGIFSLDAIHPTNTGFAIIANEFIKALNAQRDAGIPRVNVKQIKRNDPLVFPGDGHRGCARGKVSEESFGATRSIIGHREVVQ